MTDRTTDRNVPDHPFDVPRVDDLARFTYRPPTDPFGLDVVLDELDDGAFRLTWGDRVANVWAERYADPAVAFARLAVLLRGVATGGFFLHQGGDAVATAPDGGEGPAGFVADADRFLVSQLVLPTDDADEVTS
jgi:hypothetical protein